MEQFNLNELQALLALSKRSQISGEEALPVAMLQQKLTNLISKSREQTEQSTKEQSPKEDKKAEDKKVDSKNS